MLTKKHLKMEERFLNSIQQQIQNLEVNKDGLNYGEDIEWREMSMLMFGENQFIENLIKNCILPVMVIPPQSYFLMNILGKSNLITICIVSFNW